MIALRPSLLPKLAACPKFEPQEDAGPAAERGTALDIAFRAEIAGLEPEVEISLDDGDAIQWALDTARILAGDAVLDANEENLRIEAAGMEGTADLLCEARNWSADLKSGQVRNYYHQQAAYALGFMDRYFLDEWTVYLLFCDERHVVRLDFTREEAEAAIRDVKARRLDPLSVPTPCDYCGWCARRWRCQERLETVAWFLRLDPATVNMEEEAKDPKKLAALLDLTHEVCKDDGLHDFLKKKASDHLLSGEGVPGWKLCSGKETRTVCALRIQETVNGKSLLQKAGTQAVFAAFGNMSATKFEALWVKANGEGSAPPADWIETKRGAAYVAKAKAKKGE